MYNVYHLIIKEEKRSEYILKTDILVLAIIPPKNL